MFKIVITDENYDFYEDLYNYGLDMLYSKNDDERETGSMAFHASIIGTGLEKYSLMSDEVKVKEIGFALDEYDRLSKNDEMETDDDEWEEYTYERECYPHL